MTKTVIIAAMLSLLVTAFITVPARADEDDWHDNQRSEWQEEHWRQHEWREHERAEAREELEERAYPYYYAPPPVNAYYYPPPIVNYAPRPYYTSGIYFNFGSD